MDDDKGKLLVAVVAVLSIVLSGWVVANWEPQRTGIILMSLSFGGLLLFVFGWASDFIFNIDDDAEGPEITGMELVGQTVGGLVGGVIPIVLSLITPLSIGLPIIALSVFGQGFVSILVAPFVEELFFLMLAVAVYKIMLKAKDSAGLAILVTLLLVPIVFAAYHWYAYGASFLVSGAFLGAAVFRLITLLVVLLVSAASSGEPGFSIDTVASVIVTCILMHLIYNAFIFTRALSIVGG